MNGVLKRAELLYLKINELIMFHIPETIIMISRGICDYCFPHVV